MRWCFVLFLFWTTENICTASRAGSIWTSVRHYAFEVIDKAGGKTECANHLKNVIADLFRRKPYAIRMFDAWAKLNPGLTDGNIIHFGNFDQCLKISEQKQNGVIEGQYCTFVAIPSKNITSQFSFMLDAVELTDWMGIKKNLHITQVITLTKFVYSICIPKSCSVQNLQKIWNYVENTFRIPAHAVFVDTLCSYKDKVPQPYWFDKYVFAFFGLILLATVLCTLYDVAIYQYLEEKELDIFISFSLYTNTRKLFSGPKEDEDNPLSCINGIKIISMLWVLLGHRFLINMFSGNINAFYVFEWKEKIENTIFTGASFSVDTFIMTSGLLLSYGVAKYKYAKQKERPIPYGPLIIYRILRLCPALFAVILFYLSVLKYMGDGPGWAIMIKKLAGSCEKTWWVTMLFMTNQIDFGYQCVEQSWSLAVDSQLYFLSPLLLVPLYKNPLKATLGSLLFIAFSAGYAFKTTIDNNYGATYFEGNKAYHEYMYQPTIIRCPTWIIGVLFGYFIYCYQKVPMSKVLTSIIWLFSSGTMIFLILIHLQFTGDHYDAWKSATFNALARPAWAVALSLMIFACVSGHGGFANRFLSLPIFHILIRLSYSIFLTHFGVLMFLNARKKHYSHFDNLRGYHEFFGDLAFTLFASVVLSLLFEAPFINIGKVLFKKEIAEEKQNTKHTHSGKRKNKKNYVVCVYSVDNKGKVVMNKKLD